jgi:3'-5' exoribonuclease 1
MLNLHFIMNPQRKEPRFLLVVDLEATCDDTGRIPRFEMETIEIGAVLLDTANPHTIVEKVAELATFVRPVRHPILSVFCKSLTTINQSDVERAPKFPEALAMVRELITKHGGPTEVLFSSWGDYDRNQFLQDARFHRISLPFGPNHLNLKKRFSETFNITKKLGMSQALARVNLKPEGTHHRGIDDARNIARLVPFLLKNPSSD